MSVIREHKWLVLLMVLSLAVIGLGVYLIHQANSQQEQIDRLNEIARQAEEELQKTAAYPDVPIPDIIPEESLAKVKALNGKQPDVGTEDWCEVMMTKESSDWTSEEQSQFAQHCI